MTGLEVEKLIEEARALLLIPDIGKSLKHKILELKATISGNIDFYQTEEKVEVIKLLAYCLAAYDDFYEHESFRKKPVNK